MAHTRRHAARALTPRTPRIASSPLTSSLRKAASSRTMSGEVLLSSAAWVVRQVVPRRVRVVVVEHIKPSLSRRVRQLLQAVVDDIEPSQDFGGEKDGQESPDMLERSTPREYDTDGREAGGAGGTGGTILVDECAPGSTPSSGSRWGRGRLGVLIVSAPSSVAASVRSFATVLYRMQSSARFLGRRTARKTRVYCQEVCSEVLDSVQLKACGLVAVTLSAVEELRLQSKRSLPGRFAGILDGVVRFSHEQLQELFRHAAQTGSYYHHYYYSNRGADGGSCAGVGSQAADMSPLSWSHFIDVRNGANAVLLSYSPSASLLPVKLDRRIRRMMHYNVDLRPFQATVKVIDLDSHDGEENVGSPYRGAKLPRSPSPHATASSTARETTIAAAATAAAPTMRTPLSFPTSPHARRALLSDFTSFTDELLLKASAALEIKSKNTLKKKRLRRRKHDILGASQKSREQTNGSQRQSRRQAAAEHGVITTHVGQGMDTAPLKASPCAGRKRGASLLSEETVNDTMQLSGSRHPEIVRFDAAACHSEITLSCGGYCATKTYGNRKFCSARANTWLQEDAWVYFEMHISRLALLQPSPDVLNLSPTRSTSQQNQTSGGNGVEDDLSSLGITVGLSTCVAARALSLSAGGGGQNEHRCGVSFSSSGVVWAPAGGDPVSAPLAQRGFGSGDTVGVLALSRACSSGDERAKRSCRRVTAYFTVNGIVAGSARDTLVQCEGDKCRIFPTLLLRSPQTFVLAHFSAADMRYSYKCSEILERQAAQLGSVAAAEEIVALDGTPISLSPRAGAALS